MNTRSIYLLSVGLNVLLLAGIAYALIRGKHESSGLKTAVAAGSDGGKPPMERRTIVVDVPGEPFTWADLVPEDLPAYVRNLRTLGCPELTVRDIIYAEVDKYYARKIRELNQRLRIERSGMSMDFWKPFASHHQALRERAETLLRLNLERNALLFSLLGVDVERERNVRHGKPDETAGRLGFLSPQQAKQAQEIAARFRDMEQVSSLKFGRYSGPERFDELAGLERERDAELLKILSASELAEYKLRESPLAYRLRVSLQSIPVTEQEYRMLYRIEEKYYHPFQRPPDRDDPASVRAIQEELKRKRQEVESAISSASYRDSVVEKLAR